MKTKTMQELADFFDEPIEIYDGCVVFSDYMTTIIPLGIVGDYKGRENGYRVNPDRNAGKMCCGRIVDYLNNCDIGASSKTMFIALLGGTPKEVNYPHDNGDFERCYDVFEHFPELYNNLDNVSKLNKEWKAITDVWKLFGWEFCKEHIDSASVLVDFIKYWSCSPCDKEQIKQMRKILNKCK
ncbi:MAG: hypothetical protein M0R51_14420 [Clostridia bacterium]|jgi:hypothetical protein|nr:hypothetical protein [Clostridia bacterium]